MRLEVVWVSLKREISKLIININGDKLYVKLMSSYDIASKGRMIVFCILFVSILSTAFVIFTKGIDLDDDDKNKEISKTVFSASLSISGLLIAVLAYSFSSIKSTTYPTEKEPFRKLANFTYFLILLSITEASFSLTYLFTTEGLWLYLQLIFIYVEFITLIMVFGIWLEKELAW